MDFTAWFWGWLEKSVLTTNATKSKKLDTVVSPQPSKSFRPPNNQSASFVSRFDNYISVLTKIF